MSPEKVLIDTSAWILSFRKEGHQELKEFLKDAILDGTAATCPPIILELLQGCRSEEERDALRTRLESLDVLAIDQPVWERAYGLGYSLRRKGFVVPPVDLIVASAAIENQCVLLHQDRHYEMIRGQSGLLTKNF